MARKKETKVPKMSAPTAARNILVRSANWVGDAVMSTPALRAIRRNYPNARITILAKPWVVPVFEHSPDIDKVMIYQAGGRHQGLKGLMRLSRDLRTAKFDLAILIQNAFEAALLAWLARIPRRLGFTTDARTLLVTDRVRTWRRLKSGHLVDYYLGLLSGAGLKTYGRSLTLNIIAQEHENAKHHLHRIGMVTDQRVIGINPGATYGTAKRWPADRFIALSKRFIKTHNALILIFGGPGEASLGKSIADQVGPKCINLCNATTLRQAMALIGCCHAFITNDSGLMHVAAALNVPQVAIIGPTDPAATGPVNAASRMVQAAHSCERAPCLKPDCPVDHRCMTAIEVEDVLAATSTLLVDRDGV
jgi:heptosyltransferase-2